MADPGNCLGHGERISRKNQFNKLPTLPVDETKRVLTKRGPVSVEMSLSELEEDFAITPDWKVIGSEGGVLSIPADEFRMTNLPEPDSAGKINFELASMGRGTRIEHYPPAQTDGHMNEKIKLEYDEEVGKAKAAGKPDPEKVADEAVERGLVEFNALQRWLDVKEEVNLKKALEIIMKVKKIPALIIRSVDIKQMSTVLQDLGIAIPIRVGEIDLVMAYVSGPVLNVFIFEVKRAGRRPSGKRTGEKAFKKALNKAETQLTKDVMFLKSVLAGIPSTEIKFHTVVFFPDATKSRLQTEICASCLETVVICQEDLADLSLLQKKIQVPDKPDLATSRAKRNLQSFTARCLTPFILLHAGFRTEDKETLTSEKQAFNVSFADKKILRNEFVVASPQQQRAIAIFTASSTKRHLVLDGQAGTGKSLVAVQVANNLLESSTGTCEPLLVVTAESGLEEDAHIMKYLKAVTLTGGHKIVKEYDDLLREYGVPPSPSNELIHLAEALAKRWEGHQIVILVDEIIGSSISFAQLKDSFPESVRMILVLNPRTHLNSTSNFPPSFLHITLTTSYRSTIAITSLARFIAKRKGMVVPEGDIGSDVQGTRPIFFDVGRDDRKMEEALKRCRNQMGDTATILYDSYLPPSIAKMVKEQGKEAGGPWDCYSAGKFYGWEAQRVVVVAHGYDIMEQITRATTLLSVILVGDYNHMADNFYKAAQQGLVEIATMRSEADEG